MIEHAGSWQILNAARKELVFGTAIGTAWIAAKEQEPGHIVSVSVFRLFVKPVMVSL